MSYVLSSIHDDFLPLPVRGDVWRPWAWSNYAARSPLLHLEGEAVGGSSYQRRGHTRRVKPPSLFLLPCLDISFPRLSHLGTVPA